MTPAATVKVEATTEELDAGMKCLAAVLGNIQQMPGMPATLSFGGQSINVADLVNLHRKLAKALYG